MGKTSTGHGALSSGFALAALLAAGCSGRVAHDTTPAGGAGSLPVDSAGTGSSVAGDENGTAGLSDPGGALGGGTGGTSASPTVGGASGIGGSSRVDGASGLGGSNGVGSGGHGGFGPGGAAGSGPEVGVLLTPDNGWIDGASNPLNIQGAIYASADDRSAQKLSSDFTGSNACIQGSTAVVDLSCTPVPPAPDCWTTIWGAGIYLNLNQVTANSTPGTFDGSALKGFSFDLSGTNVPPSSDIRFQVETADPNVGDLGFCLQSVFKAGSNTALLNQLQSEHDSPPCIPTGSSHGSSASSEASKLVGLRWIVVTNGAQETPYDFCVSNVRALYK